MLSICNVVTLSPGMRADLADGGEHLRCGCREQGALMGAVRPRAALLLCGNSAGVAASVLDCSELLGVLPEQAAPLRFETVTRLDHKCYSAPEWKGESWPSPSSTDSA